MTHRSLTPAKYAQQMTTAAEEASKSFTTHAHVRFPNGDHVIVHTIPGSVQVTGYLNGEWIEYAGTARDAREQARLIESGAPDALWTVPAGQTRRIAAAIDGAAGAATLDAIPEADSPDDVDERTVELSDGIAYVDHTEGRVEVTLRLRGRLAGSLILSPAEADALGMALARPHGPTTGDLFAVADAMHLDAAALVAEGRP